jgi:hypothetical protein
MDSPAKVSAKQGLPKGFVLLYIIALVSIMSLGFEYFQTTRQFMPPTISAFASVEKTYAVMDNTSKSSHTMSGEEVVSKPQVFEKEAKSIPASFNKTAKSRNVADKEPSAPKTEPVSIVTSSPAPPPANNAHSENDSQQEAAAAIRLKETLKPLKNHTSCSWGWGGFYSGYRNQIMAFTVFVMEAKSLGCEQLLIDKFTHKDTFGTNRRIPHETLFDVVHWNSHFPDLPRMISCDPEIFHQDYNCSTNNWIVPPDTQWNATSPHRLSGMQWAQHRLFGRYKRYSKATGPFATPDFPNKVDMLMMKGALRPSPALQTLIDKLIRGLDESNGNDNNNSTTSPTTGGTMTPYMTLHARVEPDMIKHPVCRQFKETNLTKIFEMVEATFPDPPATKMFMPINRQYMEQEGYPNQKNPNATNWIAVENLAALNRAVKQGLWGGRVKVFEFGANALKGTKFEDRPSTTGAMLNYYIALGGNVFIGTEISSYSVDLLSTRFYTGNRENYRYLPSGLVKWPADGDTHPPGFSC